LPPPSPWFISHPPLSSSLPSFVLHLFTTMLCHICAHDPCKHVVYKEMIEGELSTLPDSLGNSKKWNHLYRCFVFNEYGSLGCRNCICIPECVVAFIRVICPDPNNQYTNIMMLMMMDSMHVMNHSSWSTWTLLGPISILLVEREWKCVLHSNIHFCIDKVRSYITQSPVEGWNVTFPSSDFTDATFICYVE
jgi:hypothetical protein